MIFCIEYERSEKNGGVQCTHDAHDAHNWYKAKFA